MADATLLHLHLEPGNFHMEMIYYGTRASNAALRGRVSLLAMAAGWSHFLVGDRPSH